MTSFWVSPFHLFMLRTGKWNTNLTKNDKNFLFKIMPNFEINQVSIQKWSIVYKIVRNNLCVTSIRAKTNFIH